ncbi:Melanoma-associated antigen G1 [Spatholobus suberectus]|nr:Melanoma-associated antigen G1 [Spatholobus suberectus]
MRELQRALPSSKTQTRSSQQSVVADSKSYILISQLPPNVYEKYVVDVNTAHLSGFTFVIISIVYLAGGKIPEENLWSQMKRMGLGEGEASHPVLGNVKQALELLVQQRYLQKDKVNGPEGNTVYYELAERALDGPMNDRVKEYISQIVKDNASVGAA